MRLNARPVAFAIMAASIARTCTDMLPSEPRPSSCLLTRPYNSNGNQHSSASIISGNVVSLRKQQHISSEASLSVRPRTPSMPMSTGSQSSLLASLPSFGSVFGDGSDNQSNQEVGDLSNHQNPSRIIRQTHPKGQTAHITSSHQ